MRVLYFGLAVLKRFYDIGSCWPEQKNAYQGATIAQWIHVRLPSCRPGFESQAHLLHFYQYIFELRHAEKTKKNKLRPGLAHFKINSQSQIFVLLHQVVLTANPSPLQLEDGWSVNGVGRHYSHKFGYGLMDAGAIVDLAARWPGIGKQVKLLLQLLRGQYFEAFLKMGYSQPLFLFVFSTNSQLLVIANEP